jgi:hypothetical protein
MLGNHAAGHYFCCTENIEIIRSKAGYSNSQIKDETGFSIRLYLDVPSASGNHYRSGSVIGSQLGQYAFHVILHRMFGDFKIASDRLVRLALRHLT